MPPHTNVAARAFHRLKTTGARRTVLYYGHLLDERLRDSSLGIRTTGNVVPSFSVDRPDLYKPYTPTAYRDFHAAMRAVDLGRGRDVFVDYGAGKGRILVLAAMYPFSRVVGVEISRELADIARRNVERASRQLRCRDVEVITMDAARFACPDDATVLHFFDPFAGEVLEAVLESVRASLAAAPRPLTILYADAAHFAPLAERCDWLRKRAVIPFSIKKGSRPIQESYYVYEAVWDMRPSDTSNSVD